ncbi:MAG: tyrosine recombinase XerC [Marmoricola sp.]
MADRKRRQYKSGSVFQAHAKQYGCPDLVDGVRPPHKCKARWMGTYESGFTKAGKRRRKTVTGPTEAAVKERLRVKLKELGTEQAVTKRLTVKAWSDTWLGIAEKENRPNTHSTDKGAVGWIVETIGHVQLEHLTPEDIRAVHSAIEATRSSSTAARYHGTLSRMLKAAAADGHYIPSNVFLVKKPEAAVNDRDAMKTIEALSVLKAATELPHSSRWVAAFLQGMRQGECLGLTWDEVGESSLKLAWQLQPLPYRVPRDRSSGFRVPRGYESRQLDGQMHLVRPKSKAGWREIPMLPVMWQALEAWRSEAPDNPHGLVWPAADGRPASENDDRQEFYGLQGLAEIGHPAGRYYKVHESRHTTGTLLRLLNVPDEIRLAIMGWSSVASSQNYEHIDAQRFAEMRQALQQVATALELG